MFARGAQMLPQRPQLVVDVFSATSQPSAGSVLQSPKPDVQVNAQALSDPHRAIVAFTGVAQASERVARPSPLHTVLDAVPAGHVAVPGVHTQPEHNVPLHVDAAGQVTVVKPLPSAVHTRTVRASVHIELPGTQVRATQAPLRHDSVAGHGVGV